MKTATIGWIVAGVLIIVAAVWYYSASQREITPTTDTGVVTQQPATAENTTNASLATSATILYTAGGGFSPQGVTIAKGGTVTFVNQGSSRMWVAADVHPSHELYDGTTRSMHCAAGYAGSKPFDQCAAGSSYSFTFDKVGTWTYHNHAEASATGVVTVQ